MDCPRWFHLAQDLNDFLVKEREKVAVLQHDLVTTRKTLRKTTAKVLLIDSSLQIMSMKEFEISSSLRLGQTYFGPIQDPWLNSVAAFTSLQANDLKKKVDASTVKQQYVSQSFKRTSIRSCDGRVLWRLLLINHVPIYFYAKSPFCRIPVNSNH